MSAQIQSVPFRLYLRSYSYVVWMVLPGLGITWPGRSLAEEGVLREQNERIDPASPSGRVEAPATPKPPPPPPRDVPAIETEDQLGLVDWGPLAVSAPARGAYVHDGFYLRAALGANYGRAFVQSNRLSKPDVSIIGMGPSLELWAGSSVPPGFVVGFNFSVADISSEAAEIGEESRAGSSLAFLIGGFLDAYPNPREGYHFGGSIGIAGVTANTGQEDAEYFGAGLGFAVFAGYDAWVGPELSVGGLLRLSGAITRDRTAADDSDIKQGTAYGAQLLVTVAYH